MLAKIATAGMLFEYRNICNPLRCSTSNGYTWEYVETLKTCGWLAITQAGIGFGGYLFGKVVFRWIFQMQHQCGLQAISDFFYHL